MAVLLGESLESQSKLDNRGYLEQQLLPMALAAGNRVGSRMAALGPITLIDFYIT